MSRSRKKHPIIKDSPGKELKRIANKRVRNILKRNLDERLLYKSYRKTYPQYDLCDWVFHGGTFEEYHQSEIECAKRCKTKVPTRKEAYKKWLTTYVRK